MGVGRGKVWRDSLTPAEREAHLATQREYAKRFRAENPGVVQVRHVGFKAKKLGVTNTLDIFDWRELLVQYDNRCVYCGCKPPVLEIEHKLPMTRQGGNIKANVVPACKSCNSRKQTRTPSEFREASA